MPLLATIISFVDPSINRNSVEWDVNWENSVIKKFDVNEKSNN